MAETELEKKEILEKAYWNINLRNIVLVVAVFLGAAGAISVRAYPPLEAGLSLCVLVLFYNNIILLFLKKKGNFLSVKHVLLFCMGLLFGDILIITFLVHFTGGILSPFILMYLFPVLVAGMTIPEQPRYAQALSVLVILFCESLLVLEHYGILEPLVVIQQGKEVYQDINLTLYFLFVFPVFVIIAVFLSTNLAGMLARGKRILVRQIVELKGARGELEKVLEETNKKASEISILYEISSREIYPLNLFISRLAEITMAETAEIIIIEKQKPKTLAAFGFPAPEIPPREVLVVPLLHNGEKIGELKLSRFKIKNMFSEDEKRILNITVDKITNAVVHERVEAQRRVLEQQLKQNLEELKEFHDVAVGNELRLIELEKEVNALLAKLNKPKKY